MSDEIESLVKKAKEKAAVKELSALHKVVDVEEDKVLTSD